MKEFHRGRPGTDRRQDAEPVRQSSARALLGRLTDLAGSTVGFAVAGFLVLGAACLTVALGQGLEWLVREQFGLFLLLAATPFLIMLVNRERAARELVRHAERGHWDTVDPKSREWPWDGLRLRGTIRVARAWAFTMDGIRVVAGDVRWTGNAFAGATDRSAGRGVFVVLRLPDELPPMAMRLPFQVVGDSPLLQRPALRLAFLGERIPPWTARGHELFTIEPAGGWVTAGRIEECARRALLIVDLLQPAEPDTDTDPGSEAA